MLEDIILMKDSGHLGDPHFSVQFCSLSQDCSNCHSLCWSENRNIMFRSNQRDRSVYLVALIDYAEFTLIWGHGTVSPIDEIILEAEVLNLPFMLPSYQYG